MKLQTSKVKIENIKSLQIIWILSLLMKLVLAAILPLSADEAYYWVWSHNLQGSYYDHPPFIAWILRIGHFLEPFGHSVRWPLVILGHLTMGIWILSLKNKISSEKLRHWALMILLFPLLGVGSIIATPDVPVVFFWSLSIYFFSKVLSEKNIYNYFFLGTAMGLGFCSKYHIVLLVPSFFVYLTFEKKWSQLKIQGVFLTIISGLIFSLPVLLWNYQNDFASFKFQLNHGLQNKGFLWENPLNYVFTQVIFLFPLLFIKKSNLQNNDATLWKYSFFFPIFFFFLTSFRAPVEGNWSIIAFPSFFAWVAWKGLSEKGSKIYFRFWGIITAVFFLFISIPNLRMYNEKFQEPFIFLELSKIASKYTPLYTSSYQMASSLWYFSKKPTPKLQGMNRFDFFDTLEISKPKGNYFYLLKKTTNTLPLWILNENWKVEILEKLPPNFEVLKLTQN